MAKLFVFGIGGTGSRVIKSLSMLLASGVDMGNNINEIVPIIIDVDKGNQDLTRTVEILKNYETLYNTVASKPNYKGFFQTKQTNLYQTAGKEYRLTFPNVDGKTFGRYIDAPTLRGQNSDMIDLLFSGTFNDKGTKKSLLDMDMSVGFQGNPKLGCVVLDQFKGNPDFNTFAQHYDQSLGDRIFIISSIHGGTGAAGFPLLLKNIRHAELPTPNPALLKQAIVGAVTVLPYFDLEEGDIKSADFISKTKAALQYYEKNVNPYLNSMYYIGNSSNKSYQNNKGGVSQQNDAHFIEVAAAMAIVDFAKQSSVDIASQGNRFLEYGVNDFSNSIDFSILGKASNDIIESPLSKYYFFNRYLKQRLIKSIERKQQWTVRSNPKITKDFTTATSGFYQPLGKFNVRFDEWLNELKNNKPQFSPFIDDAELLDSISNRPSRKSNVLVSLVSSKNYDLMDGYLNEIERNLPTLTVEQKFIELFNTATSKLLTEKYN